MASRLQVQESKLTTTASLQTTANVENPTGFQVPTVLLAQHQIEPELLGVRPRFVVKSTADDYSIFDLAKLGPAGFPLYSLWRKYPDTREEIIWFLIAVFALWSVVVHLKNHRLTASDASRLELLRTGIPHNAVVEEVGSHTDLLERWHSLTYWYHNDFGQLTRETTKIASRSAGGQEIAPGDTFTLLVSPTDPESVVPYFNASPFRVIPIKASYVSHEVSTKLAAQLVQTAQYGATFVGPIESELLGVTPRPVRICQGNIHVGVVMGVVLSALVTGVCLFWPQLQTDFALRAGFIAGFAFTYIYCKAYWQSVFKTRSILQNYTPSSALVESIEVTRDTEYYSAESQVLIARYRYTPMRGEEQTGELTMKRNRAWQLGIRERCTFTVLHNPRNLADHTPYFQITESSIVGAMGAKILPP